MSLLWLESIRVEDRPRFAGLVPDLEPPYIRSIVVESMPCEVLVRSVVWAAELVAAALLVQHQELAGWAPLRTDLGGHPEVDVRYLARYC